MPHISPSVSQPPSVYPVTPPLTSTTSPPPQAAEAAPSISEPPQDQASVTSQASFDFQNEPVSFPEPLPTRAQELPGFGEILGGLAVLMVPGGAPSASFTPVIQQAEKNLQARRAPRPAEPIDTAASDEKLQKP